MGSLGSLGSPTLIDAGLGSFLGNVYTVCHALKKNPAFQIEVFSLFFRGWNLSDNKSDLFNLIGEQVVNETVPDIWNRHLAT